MTEDKARKIATRQRMAETGEPYSVARHVVEREQCGDEAPDRPVADRPGAESAAEDEGGLTAREWADRARERADQARERAEHARERAEQADEAAMMAHDAADMAAEAANLTREWADEQEQEQAQRRAAQARAAAQEAQHRADRAEREAERAEEQADLAEEQANLAEEGADEAEEEDGWEPGGHPHHRARQVHHQGHWEGPRPPRPPQPPRFQGWHEEPADRIPDRVGQVLQRFEEFRERAEGMVSQVERIFNLNRDQAPRPAGPPEPAGAPEPTGPVGSD